jgi:hypothetical protein
MAEAPLFRLYRHRPTGAWIPLMQNTSYATPGERYIPELCERYQINQVDVEIVETAELPSDFSDNQLTETVPVSPAQTRREEFGRVGLPSPAEIDALVDSTFAEFKPDQRAFLKRLAKLVRLLSSQ